VVGILPNGKNCGCGWTLPAATIPNNHLKRKVDNVLYVFCYWKKKVWLVDLTSFTGLARELGHFICEAYGKSHEPGLFYIYFKRLKTLLKVKKKKQNARCILFLKKFFLLSNFKKWRLFFI
jgi:hypothetical protein